METVLNAIADWIKGILAGAIMSNLSGLFDAVNTQVGDIAAQVGTSPESFEPRVFAMIKAVSNSAILPIAGVFLTLVACYELVQMVTEHNNLASFEPALITKWIIKTGCAVYLISNTFDITMAVFDLAQTVVAESSGIIAGNTAVDDTTLLNLQTSLMTLELGELLALYLQSFLIGFTMKILGIAIFVIVYGRIVEIYLAVSLAPIPFSTFGSKEQSQIGQNYLRSLLALGLQGFLIMICVGIYAVLIQGVSFASDPIASIWGVIGYTVLLCFTLLKTGTLARSILNAH